jgi:hypothetical protein
MPEQDPRSVRAAAQAALTLPTPFTPIAPPVTSLTPAVGAAGNVPAGTHTYKVTYTKAGQESEASPVSISVNPGVGSHISITAMAVSPDATVTGRNIYRQIAGSTGLWLFVGSQADNTTTTFDDNIADTALGAPVPQGGQPEADTYQERGRRGALSGL